MLSKLFKSALFLFLVIGLAACGGNEEAAEAPETDAMEAPAAETAATTIEIGPVGNEMKYDKTEFTVRAGEEVRIVFTNTATSPAMRHNVVVLQSTDAIERVGTAAIQAGEANSYIPEDPAILAHTPMSGPGETVEVTFTAPAEPGDYPFICTFPGHYMLMQGTMKVEAAAGL